MVSSCKNTIFFWPLTLFTWIFYSFLLLWSIYFSKEEILIYFSKTSSLIHRLFFFFFPSPLHYILALIFIILFIPIVLSCLFHVFLRIWEASLGYLLNWDLSVLMEVFISINFSLRTVFLVAHRVWYIVFLALFESKKFYISSLVSFVTCYSFKSTLFIWQWDDSACDMSWVQSLGLMWLGKEGIDSSAFLCDVHMCTVVCMPPTSCMHKQQ